MATDHDLSFEGELRLDHLSALDIKGEHAEKFLQGQTSAQVSLANATFAPLTCFCTPKGRVIANGQLMKVAEQHYRLLLSTTLAEKLAGHLKKFAVFYQVTLEVRDDIALVGAGPARAAELTQAAGLTLPENAYLQANGNDALALRLPGEPRYLFCLPSETNELAAPSQALENAWRLADIKSGVAILDEAQEDHFLPQMINWEALGGISFKKGCYTGQEVVARAHFRGQVKKRLVRASASASALPAAGDSLCDENGKSLGEVVMSAFSGEGQLELLAVVATKAIDTPLALYLGEAPVTLETLPYPVERLDPEQLSAQLASQVSA
ncbi:YgfZ/GcvT domain-containing protein [Halomonas sp. HNIBRBA4712]|uniref:CAF17-like 4Fe-4S cluster assembly/insertion protein YgfZ n=1 Tax=Halomonas sp. HNIBRBA4712 TaxID=3373087 RepID=UPI003747362B